MNKTFWVAGLLPVAAIAAPQTDKLSTEQPMVVTATRFSQPEASILAPVNIVTRDEIDRMQAKTVTEVMRTLPGVETLGQLTVIVRSAKLLAELYRMIPVLFPVEISSSVVDTIQPT